MNSNKIVNWLVVGLVAFIMLGVAVPIMLLSWGNLTSAFSGTVLAGLFSSTIGEVLIGGAVIYIAINLIKLKK